MCSFILTCNICLQADLQYALYFISSSESKLMELVLPTYRELFKIFNFAKYLVAISFYKDRVHP